MPGSLQAKLLRVLEDGSMRRIGSVKERRVNVRLLAATNRKLGEEVAAGRFREDLYYRINVMSLELPPLRQRTGDIPLLVKHFLGLAWSVEPEAQQAIQAYHWPGNVRELQNVLSALAVAAPGRGSVRPSLLPAAITGAARVTSCRLADARSEFERRCVEVALARAGGSRTRAAAALGLSRQGLLKTLARLGLEAPAATGEHA